MKIVALYFVLVAAWWVIVFKLVQLSHVKTLLLLFALFALQCPAAGAQGTDAPDGTPIASAVVSGLDIDELSPGLRREIDALTGTRVNARELDMLARRIEGERPGTIVAVRSVAVGGDDARVIFLVAANETRRNTEDDDVNARYVVESVTVDGVPEARLSQPLRDDLHAVAGTRLRRGTAERLIARVRDELPGYDVTRRMTRGSERGRLRMLVRVRPGESMRWLHFTPSRSKLLYHTEQGWSGLIDVNIGQRDWRVSPFFAVSNADDLVEEYSAYGIRIETRNAGIEPLGFGVEIAHYDADWRDRTLNALSAVDSARLYDSRAIVAPSVSLALTPQLHVSGGVSIAQLQSDAAFDASSLAANVYTLSAGYDERVERERVRHDFSAAFDARVSSSTLQSDYDFRRYLARAAYRATWGRHTLLASGMAGGLSGIAPLFERFTLGDSTTLRGWDKYDIGPVGGNRVGHASIEYRNRGVAFFLDGGSVWNAPGSSQPRFSTGFGLHSDNVFATVAFPLNTPDVRATFMAGVRF
jgi:hypothetical protein